MAHPSRRDCIQGTLAAFAGAGSALPALAGPSKSAKGGMKLAELFGSPRSRDVKLARQVGAGVGVSNGWIEYTGLVRLPADVRAKMMADIETLFSGTRALTRTP